MRWIDRDRKCVYTYIYRKREASWTHGTVARVSNPLWRGGRRKGSDWIAARTSLPWVRPLDRPRYARFRGKVSLSRPISSGFSETHRSIFPATINQRSVRFSRNPKKKKSFKASIKVNKFLTIIKRFLSLSPSLSPSFSKQFFLNNETRFSQRSSSEKPNR